MTRWLTDPAQWSRAADIARAAGTVGWDSETFGHEVTETTAPWRARVHVWSLGVLTAQRHPLGHRVASGAVFPREALFHGPLRAVLEDPAVVKVAWNAPHDVHAAANEGVTVRGAVDGLQRLRVQRPDLGRWGLKSVCHLVGRTLSTFESVVTHTRPDWSPARLCVHDLDEVAPDHVWWTGPERVAAAPAGGWCRRRHPKKAALVWGEVTGPVALETIVPGHPRHPALVEYAAEDAVTAAELWDRMDRTTERAPAAMAWAPEWTP